MLCFFYENSLQKTGKKTKSYTQSHKLCQRTVEDCCHQEYQSE